MHTSQHAYVTIASCLTINLKSSQDSYNDNCNDGKGCSETPGKQPQQAPTIELASISRLSLLESPPFVRVEGKSLEIEATME